MRAGGMRIVIALDPASPNADAFAALHALTAGRLAGDGEQPLEVCGLFVEDDDVLRYSSLPFARQVCVSSGVLEEVSVLRLEQQLRARAARMRTTFEVAVRAFQGSARFDVRRGGVVAELRAAAGDADLLVIARCGAGAGHRAWFGVPIDALLAAPPCSTLFVQEPWRTGTSVLVASIDNATPMPDVARHGARIAQADRLQLHELDFVSDGVSAATQFGAEPPLTTANLIRACQRLHARVLVLPDVAAVRTHVDLVALVSEVPASVLLVQV